MRCGCGVLPDFGCRLCYFDIGNGVLRGLCELYFEVNGALLKSCVINTFIVSFVERFRITTTYLKKNADAGRNGKETAEFLKLRDSYVPVFLGQPSDYREYRKRLMQLSKR